MKTILQFLFALASAGMAWAQTQIVVPDGLENVEGNSSSADLFVNGTAHLQQVYASTVFQIGAPIARIDAISFRIDTGFQGTFLGSWSLSMFMSTTTRSVDNLSPVFNDNVGADFVRVFGGPMGILVRDSDVNPRPFEVVVRLESPFFYEPSKGNLSIDILAAGTRNLALDAQISVGDSVGRVYANPDALTGTVDSLGLSTRFDITPVPEPSAIALALCNALVFFLWTKYRSGKNR